MVNEHWYYVMLRRLNHAKIAKSFSNAIFIHNVCIILHMWTSFYSFNIVTKLFISGVYVFYDVSRGEMLMISYIRRLFDISHRGLFLIIDVSWITFYVSRSNLVRKFVYHTNKTNYIKRWYRFLLILSLQYFYKLLLYINLQCTFYLIHSYKNWLCLNLPFPWYITWYCSLCVLSFFWEAVITFSGWANIRKDKWIFSLFLRRNIKIDFMRCCIVKPYLI